MVGISLASNCREFRIEYKKFRTPKKQFGYCERGGSEPPFEGLEPTRSGCKTASKDLVKCKRVFN